MSEHIPEAVIRTRDQRRRRISLIWSIPLVTVLIAAWLAWDTVSKRGPLITIWFESAASLQATQSHIRYRDVDLGVVEKIALTPDRKHVVVTARMTDEARGLLTDKAQFWIVRPRFFAGAVSGLETLVSGSYIQMEPSGEGGTPIKAFVGLEDPPVLHSSVPGRAFQLKARRIGSLNPGSPIFFRDVAAGEVLGWDVGDMARDVTIQIFVRDPYAQYVHDKSVFWNASGANIQLGGGGLKLELESFRALVLGGVAFDTPDSASSSPRSDERHEFELLPDRQTADAAMFDRSLHFATVFTGSVSGLDAGAPVVLHGIRIGVVKSVGLRYQPSGDTIVAEALYDVEPGRITGLELPTGGDLDERVRELVHRGLRVQLESSSLVTGAKQMVMDVFPAATEAQFEKRGDTFVIPQVGGDRGDIAASAADLFARLNAIPFEQIGDNLNQTLAGLNTTVNDTRLRASIENLNDALRSARGLFDSLNKGAEPMLRDLPRIAANLDDAVKHADQLIASLDSGNGGGSAFGRDLNRLMSQLTDTARSIRILAELLTRHPEALVRGRAEVESR